MKIGVRTGVGAFLFVLWLAGVVPVVPAEVFGDLDTKRFHTETCGKKAKIQKKNLMSFASEAEAGSRGFYPCPECIPVAAPAAPPQVTRQLSAPIERGKHYVGETASRIYHYYWCPVVSAGSAGPRREFASVEAAVKAGYAPCLECNPPALYIKKDVEWAGPTAAEKAEQNLKQAEQAADHERLKLGEEQPLLDKTGDSLQEVGP